MRAYEEALEGFLPTAADRGGGSWVGRTSRMSTRWWSAISARPRSTGWRRRARGTTAASWTNAPPHATNASRHDGEQSSLHMINAKAATPRRAQRKIRVTAAASSSMRWTSGARDDDPTSISG